METLGKVVTLLVIAWLVWRLFIRSSTPRSWLRRHPDPASTKQFAPLAPEVETDADLAALAAVQAATWSLAPLLGPAEGRLFLLLEKIVLDVGRGHRVFSQVNLGEILSTENDPDRKGYYAVQSKRVDFLIVDRAARPIVAIEYQGEAHYQNNAAARDALKRYALESVGVGFIEVFPDWSEAAVRRDVLVFLKK